jgi:hypothetical protein
MKRLHVLATLLVASVTGLTAETMTANIPFDFQLGPNAMPAGEYRVDHSRHLLTVRNKDGHHTAILLTLPASRRKAMDQGVMEFRRYGDTYFFSGVWDPNSRDGATIVKTPREKELASRAKQLQPTTIALTKR